MKIKKWNGIIALGFLVSISSCAVSQTKRTDDTKAPVVHQPQKAQAASTVKQQDDPTIKELAKSIKKYVKKKTKEDGGYFKVYDPKTRKNILLKLVDVQTDHISKLEKGNYFTCSDYVDTAGTKYDLDIFMHYQDGDLKPTKTTIHKVDGKPRYYWYKVGDKWKTKSAGHGTEGPEHPRH